ncbi:lipase [Acrasis kona]|uniref:Lipase n=1 Tax=Acrasis kona TaxID=1008807 RepID=A0AAW2Z8J4_9EUKA
MVLEHQQIASKNTQITIKDGTGNLKETFNAPCAGIFRLNASISGWYTNGADVSISYNNNKETTSIALTRVMSRSNFVDLQIQFPCAIEVTVSCTVETNIDLTLTQLKKSQVQVLDDILTEHTTNDKNEARTRQKHLVVLCHGNHGSAPDMYEIGETMRSTFNESKFFQNESHEFFAFYPTCNQFMKTHDGIKVCSSRLVEQFKTFVNNYFEADDKILLSMVGHSLGGLFLRCSIPHILNDPQLGEMLIPVSLMTISSPNLGARKATGGNVISSTIKYGSDIYMNYLLGQTGKELCLTDDEKKPLLLRMSRPESKYINALSKFKSITAAGAIEYDIMVPHASALISSHTKFETSVFGPEGFKIASLSGFGQDKEHVSLFEGVTQDEFYDPMLEEEKEDGEFIRDSLGQIETLHAILKNLQQLKWRRISLGFTLENSRQAMRVHDMTIDKVTKLYTYMDAGTVKASSSCVSVLSRVILIDHYKECVAIRK